MKNETEALKERISLLEYQQAQEISLLREQLHSTYQSFKPVNFIRHTLDEVTSSSHIKDSILNNVIGLTTGYLSKRILIGSTRNPIKRAAGTLLQFAIANVVSKHSDTIKAVGEVMLRRIFENRGRTKNLNVEINHSVINQLKDANF